MFSHFRPQKILNSLVSRFTEKKKKLIPKSFELRPFHIFFDYENLSRFVVYRRGTLDLIYLRKFYKNIHLVSFKRTKHQLSFTFTRISDSCYSMSSSSVLSSVLPPTPFWRTIRMGRIGNRGLHEVLREKEEKILSTSYNVWKRE